MFNFKRKSKQENVINQEIRIQRDYRHISDEMEILGRRIDAARGALKACKEDTWGQTHWQSVLDRLLFQWRLLPILHDSQATATVRPRWKVRYNFFERDDGIGTNNIVEIFLYTIFDKLRGGPNLDESWERARNARLAKAPQ